ncbi:arsenate reductase ArsC [Streptococcus suis]|uniref:arsenate reductase/protein-tyrosine-phosphatase family protein n=1 Tax=Streptococcus TaxID=1301 RepID=UPI000CF40C9A|nr:arsenate reductase ArsC [Streptococcus suis]
MKEKTKVAFVCVHNSCRSQIAEALAKANYAHVFDAYSAGTETKPQINQDAVRLMKRQYQIDMEETQYSKLIDELPTVDIVITMGCNVDCPYLPCRHREDWGLDDPSGQSDQVYLATMHQIEEKLQQLATFLENSNRSLSNKQGAIV